MWSLWKKAKGSCALLMMEQNVKVVCSFTNVLSMQFETNMSADGTNTHSKMPKYQQRNLSKICKKQFDLLHCAQSVLITSFWETKDTERITERPWGKLMGQNDWLWDLLCCFGDWKRGMQNTCLCAWICLAVAGDTGRSNAQHLVGSPFECSTTRTPRKPLFCFCVQCGNDAALQIGLACRASKYQCAAVNSGGPCKHPLDAILLCTNKRTSCCYCSPLVDEHVSLPHGSFSPISHLFFLEIYHDMVLSSGARTR